MMFSASCLAQTTLWDGDNFEPGSHGGCRNDGSPVVAENPERGGINTLDKNAGEMYIGNGKKMFVK